jgi:imidazolonepropionase-like amidohydrolase
VGAMQRRMLAGCVLALISLLQGCSRDAPGDTASEVEKTVFAGFTLIDGTSAAPQPDMAMTVQDGKIAWLGPQNQLPATDAQRAVDLSGKYVMPGLIDLHAHVGSTHEHELAWSAEHYTRASVFKELQNYARYGVTTVLAMGTDGDLIFDIRREPASQHPPMARVYTSGQGIVFKGGFGGLPGLNHPVATPEEARQEVEAQLAKGADFIKVWLDDDLGAMPKMPPEISQAVIDAAHRHDRKVLAHVFYLEDAKRLAQQGIDALVHLARDQPLDDELLGLMRDQGIWQAGTLSRDAWIVAHGAHAEYLDDPFFTRGVSPEVLKILADPERQKTIATGPRYPDYQRFAANALDNFKRVVDAGVVYGMGTDSGPPGRFGGYSAHWELELMVQAGLTPQQALIAATSKAAEILGNPDIGVVAAGKNADFVVLTANPVENIRNTRAIDMIYVDGRAVEPITRAAEGSSRKAMASFGLTEGPNPQS